MSETDSQLEAKLKDMQEYLPFLQRVIDRLRSNSEQQKDNPRKEQLIKMEMLYDLLTNKGKKLKMDTLLKCEAVLKKLHAKIDKTSFLQNANDTSKTPPTKQHISNKVLPQPDKKECIVEIVDITGPESPPPQPVEEIQPVEIPTERRCSPIIMVDFAPRKSIPKEHNKMRSHKDERHKSLHHHEKDHRNRHKSVGAKLNAQSNISPISASTGSSKVSIHNCSSIVGSKTQNQLQTRTKESVLFSRRQTHDSTDANEAYSPKECWDELGKDQKSISPAFALQRKSMCDAELDKSYRDTIFNFKKQNVAAEKRIIERSDAKSAPSALNEASTMPMPMKPSLISTPVKVPTIPEVLQSPPLSANDISALLKESMGNPNIPSIAEIGSRRNVKPNIDTPVADVENSKFDIVRKKFSMIPKSSSQQPCPSRDQNASSSSLPNERLALKYNPHPRTERSAFTSPPCSADTRAETSCKPSDPRLKTASAASAAVTNVPIKPQDPRLRKSNLGQMLHVSNANQKSPLLPTPLIGNDTFRASTNLQMPNVTQKCSYSPASYNYEATPFMSTYQNPRNVGNAHMQQFGYGNNRGGMLFSRREHSPPAHKSAYGKSWDSGLNVSLTGQKSFPKAHAAESTLRKPAVANRDSPEENWDSDPDETLGQKTCPKPSTAPGHSNFERDDIGIQSFNNPSSFAATHHTHHTHSRFNALLNDKSERIKYLESKKQKHSEPNTYAEFKKAKARAAAEESAKKIAENTAKSTEKVKENPVTSDSKATAVCSTHTSKESTLDKLYRNSNFSSCDFPKPKSAFKIPKKQETCKTKSEEKIEHNKSKESTESCNKSESDSKMPKQREAGAAPLEKSKDERIHKKKGKEENNSKSDFKSGEKKKDQKAFLNTQHRSFDSKNVEKEPQIQTKSNKKEKNVDSKIEKSNEIDVAQKQIENNVLKANKSEQPQVSNTKSSELDPQMVESVKSSDPQLQLPDVQVIHSPGGDKSNASPKPKPVAEKGDKVPVPYVVKNSEKPARILKRRNTMFVQGSVPLVDKDKILSTTALVFEDIQGNNGLRNRKDIDLKLNRRSKVLAEIFQKTDDNCTVSTQNIISGKRRTRTTVNFNEVQRTLEIFQHKKPREARKELATEAIKKPSKKVTNAKEVMPMKKTVPKHGKGKSKAKKDLEDEYESQSCTVSSTTLQSEEEVAAVLAATEDEVHNETDVDAQPSSSTVKTMSATSTTDEDKKTELLEGFVQDILNPNANTEYIFSLLRQILSEDKLKLVKEIVESAAKENMAQSCDDVEDRETEEVTGGETDCGDANMKSTVENDLSQNNEIAIKKAHKRKAKRNELDRLNEDIRDMFISKGVLTATGRRMCTLVAAEKANTSVVQKLNIDTGTDESCRKKANTAKPEATQKVVLETNYSPTGKPISPSIRKSKVVLHALGSHDLLKEKPKEKPSISDTRKVITDNVTINLDSDDEESILNDSEMVTTDTNTNQTEESFDNTMTDIPPRGMPILKPHTPIKQSEVEEVSKLQLDIIKKSKVKVKLAKMKTTPKCKKSLRSSEGKYETSKDDEMDDETDGERSNYSKIDKMQKSEQLMEIKNINKEWHSQSKYAQCCVICNIKMKFTGSHYKQKHAENYTSRLPPNLLEQYMQGTAKTKALFSVIHKKQTMWFYRCPFCLHHYRSILIGWLEHFITHTGEYFFECSRCHRPANRHHILANHIKTQCKGAKILRNCTPPSGTCVKAHVCHLCNFLQMNKQNLNKHYIQQHDYDPTEVDTLGHTITLLDLKDVEMVDITTAIELESDTLEKLSIDKSISNSHDGIDDDTGDGVEISENDVNETSYDRNVPTGDSAANENDIEKVTSTSDNSDGLTINKNPSAAGKLQSNSNIFMSTRESNDSPTMDNLTKSIFTVENEQLEMRNKSELSGISIAERLSQRFKNLREGSTVTAVSENNSKSDDTTTIGKENDVVQRPTTEDEHVSCNIVDVQDPEAQDTSLVQSCLNKSNESDGCLVIAESEMDSCTDSADEYNETVDDSAPEDDDDKWEDIEVTESAPSITSVVSTSSTNSKSSKEKNKTVFQKFSRLYASNNKLKKSLSRSMCAKKKATKKCDGQMAARNITTAVGNASVNRDCLGRTVIPHLADLLPDSPCNDPIELVPELTPVAPLQDLNDISSILDSECMSNMCGQHDVEGVDSQQTSMQEALDFVSEQEKKENSNKLPNRDGMNMQSQVHINRIENIGYSKSNDKNSFKFYCLSENCTFMYSNEAIGLETHLRHEHPQAVWKGYCNICKMQVKCKASEECELTLSDEMKHLKENHTGSPKSIESANTTENKLEQTIVPVNSDERPRLKIRRFSGDCLSSKLDTAARAHDNNANLFVQRPLVRKFSPITCPLQITSVVSLNENCNRNQKSRCLSSANNAEKPMQLPVIANVCSLTNVEERDALWPKLVRNESVEAQMYAAEPTEVPQISTNEQDTSVERTGICNTLNDSSEPQVVAEIVPIAQTTSGEYLITQTLSAQYKNNVPDAQLDCNISIASLLSASSNDLSIKSSTLQTLDRAEGENTLSQEMPSVINKMTDDATGTDSIAVVPNVFNTTENETYLGQLQKTVDEIIATTGIPDSKLYRCTIKNCKTPLTESNFSSHIASHITTLHTTNNYTYKCPHCSATYHRPSKFKMHVTSHGQHRYFCYLCMHTAINAERILEHFEEKHFGAKNMYSIPLLERRNVNTDNELESPVYYVAYSQKLSDFDVQQFGEKLIAEWRRKKQGSRTHFKPSESNLLPLTPIFQRELNCAICAYKTKVRTNLLRHLQLHNDDKSGSGQQLANVDPVNPVPCLNTNEKHFDKMTNLASSSVVTPTNSTAVAGASGSGSSTKTPFKVIYEYVPETKRYTCGVIGCQYLTISDEIFRSHLNALHGDISSYSCPLCKEEICKRMISIERIMQHLRLHGKKLYQCEECDYLHYMKNVVERHIHDKHQSVNVNLITHDRTNSKSDKRTKELITVKVGTTTCDVAATPSKIETINSKHKQKWACNICGHKAMTQQQMTTHCSAQHGSKHQYQCTHCQFSAVQLSHIMSHIEEKHKGKMREVRYVFHKIIAHNDAENGIDTRPLWLRDDPTRVRHIRGILMEDEHESEQHQKRLRLEKDLVYGNNDGDEPHSLAEDDTLTNSYEFNCFHCNTKSTKLNDLREIHWKSAHNSSPNNTSPFQYYLVKALKCIECLTLTGSWYELEEHLKSVHNTDRYIAADASTSSLGLVCGYCDFSCQAVEQLAKHNRRMAHKRTDIKRLTNSQLNEILKLGMNETYLQCTLCSDLFANRSAILAHSRSVHKGEESFSFRELTNATIYCCTKCVFTSTQELTTLRHMIDHYDGFKRCHFCSEPQTTFNGYMQHCYSDHREAVKQFAEIYPLTQIKQYLQEMQVLFPNGLVLSLHNLRQTKYGSIERIKQLYVEICKTSQQPPIPRLSIARLVASKSIEGKKIDQCNNSLSAMDGYSSRASASMSTAAAMQLAGNGGKVNCAAFSAKRIMKRRSTVALGSDENMTKIFDVCHGKKRKMIETVLRPPVPNAFQSLANAESSENVIAGDEAKAKDCELQPFSFYGQPVEPIDLSKVYTRIAISGVDSRVSVSKFKMLCKIDARVVVEKINLPPSNGNKEKKTNVHSDNELRFQNVKKACPASHKYKYA